MNPKTAYCFLDVETTGLDSQEDHIVEIAWIITDDELNAITSRGYVIEQGEEWSSVWNRIRNNEFVRKMHQESGLLGEMHLEEGLLTLDNAFDRLRDDVTSIEATTHLAGFSVHFDRGFLDYSGFPLEDVFHHRNLDLSSVKLMMGLAALPAPEIQNDDKHRALSDCQEALDFAKAVKSDLTLKSAVVF